MGCIQRQGGNFQQQILAGKAVAGVAAPGRFAQADKGLGQKLRGVQAGGLHFHDMRGGKGSQPASGHAPVRDARKGLRHKGAKRLRLLPEMLPALPQLAAAVAHGRQVVEVR